MRGCGSCPAACSDCLGRARSAATWHYACPCTASRFSGIMLHRSNLLESSFAAMSGKDLNTPFARNPHPALAQLLEPQSPPSHVLYPLPLVPLSALFCSTARASLRSRSLHRRLSDEGLGPRHHGHVPQGGRARLRRAHPRLAAPGARRHGAARARSLLPGRCRRGRPPEPNLGGAARPSGILPTLRARAGQGSIPALPSESPCLYHLACPVLCLLASGLRSSISATPFCVSAGFLPGPRLSATMPTCPCPPVSPVASCVFSANIFHRANARMNAEPIAQTDGRATGGAANTCVPCVRAVGGGCVDRGAIDVYGICGVGGLEERTPAVSSILTGPSRRRRVQFAAICAGLS